MRKSLPNYLAPRDKQPGVEKDFLYIPKKIFHTWETNEVTCKLYDAAYTWIDKNPDWEYNFFDNARCRKFIRDHFPASVLAAYDQLIPGAYRADLWRYCVLYIHGGVYADSKLVLVNPLNELLAYDTKFTATKERIERKRYWEIYNAFICAAPKHPFLKEAINRVIYNVNNRIYGEDALGPTGPSLLGLAINQALGRRVKHAFSPGVHCINNHEFTLWHFSMHNIKCRSPLIHTIYTDTSTTQACFHTRYIGYDNLRIGYKSNYSMAWIDCAIYTTNNDIKKCTHPIRYKIKSYYKQNNKKAARKLLWNQIKILKLNLKMIGYIFKYELFKPIIKLFF